MQLMKRPKRLARVIRMNRLCLLASLASVASSSCLLACGDDDGDPTSPQLEWSIDAQEIAEGGVINVQLRPRSTPREPLIIRYATADGTATAGADYLAAQGELRWEPGERDLRTITVSTTSDLALEGAEQLTLTLSDALPTPVLSLDQPIALTITDGNHLGDAFVVTNLGRLVSFDRAAPGSATHAATLTGLSEGDHLVGIDVRPRDATLIGVGKSGSIYRIDPATGQAHRVSRVNQLPPPFTHIPGDRFSVDFDPGHDLLAITSDDNISYRVNIDTGANSFAPFAPHIPLAIAYDHNVRTACRTGLYSVDTAADRLMLQPTAADELTPVGALGLDAENVELDLETTDEDQPRAFALSLLRGRSHLLGLDLTTGRATDAGELPLAIDEQATTFALRLGNAGRDVPQAPGRLRAVTQDHQLITLEPSSPRPCTSAAITGLGAYQISSLDFLPATGALYAFARDGLVGAVLRLSPTGAVERTVPLDRVIGATRWGADFDPVTSELRLVSDEGQNLRVTDLTAGTTVEDSPLSGFATGAVAASYSDALRGVATSTLYTVDPATSSILLLRNPAGGLQERSHDLSSSVARVTGFEIDGGDHQAVLAVEPAGGFETQIATLDLRHTNTSAVVRSTWPNQRLRGLTVAPPTASLFALLADQQLVELSLTAPASPRSIGAIRGLPAGEQLLAITARPGTSRSQQLVGVSSRGGLYAVNPTTAQATKLSQLVADPGDPSLPYAGLSGRPVGLSFASGDELWITEPNTPNEQLRVLRVTDLATGNTISDAVGVGSKRSLFRVLGLAIPPATAVDQRRLAFDQECHCLVNITASGVVSDLTPANSFADGLQAPLDFAPDGTAFGIRSAFPSAAMPMLFQIDRTTGAMTDLGTISAPQNPSYLHLAIAPDGVAYAMDRFGQLFRFSLDAPGQASYLGIAPLPTSERVNAIDFHPTTGQLWMLTRDNNALPRDRLYTVALDDASITFHASLTPHPDDSSDRFGILPLERPDMSFDPATDALLISGLNYVFRLPDPRTGFVITDGSLRYASPHLAATAFRGRVERLARASMLFLDVADRALHARFAPSASAPVGSFGLSLGTAGALSDLASITLAGGTDGLALAAIQRSGLAEPFSRLHRIEPETGRLIDLGPIGAGPATRSIAILLND